MSLVQPETIFFYKDFSPESHSKISIHMVSTQYETTDFSVKLV